MYTGNIIDDFKWHAHSEGKHQLPVEGSHVCGPQTEKQVTVCNRQDHVSEISPIVSSAQLSSS